MGIDSLQNHSKSIPMGTYSQKYKFTATPGVLLPVGLLGYER